MSLPTTLCGFSIKDKVGEGVYGAVYDAEWPKHTSEGILSLSRKDNKDIVLKRIKKDLSNSPDIIIEMHLLSTINHKYCMRSEEIRVEDTGGTCIIMEKMDTDLHNFLKEVDLLEDEKFTLSYKLTEGLNYLHSNNIIHRDLHTGNILINKVDHDPKITDYGLSKIYETKPFYRKNILYASYRPPELLTRSLSHNDPSSKSTYQYGPEVDVWALGLIIYKIWTKQELFLHNNNLIAIILLEIDALLQLTPSQKDTLVEYSSDIPSLTELIDLFDLFSKEPGEGKIYSENVDLNKNKVPIINQDIKYQNIKTYFDQFGDTTQTRADLLRWATYSEKLKTEEFKQQLYEKKFAGVSDLARIFLAMFLNTDPEKRLTTQEIILSFPLSIRNIKVEKISYPNSIIKYNKIFSVENRNLLISLLNVLYENKSISTDVLIHTIDLLDRVLTRIHDGDSMLYLKTIICLNLTLCILDIPFGIKYYIDFLRKMTPLNSITEEIFLKEQNIILRSVNFITYRPCISFLLSADKYATLSLYKKNLSPSNVNL